ncbi:MAG: N-acetyltransferase [Clostridia bacterium]
MISIRPCNYDEISSRVEEHYKSKDIIVDSYWEDHVLSSNHYMILWENEYAGFFAIHKESTITLFHMSGHHACHGQQVFEQIKHYEKVTNAFVPTGDEFFLSHALDSFSRMEKQAYFSVYTDKPIPADRRKELNLRLAKDSRDTELFALAKDFFDPGNIEKVLEGSPYFKVYLVEEGSDLVGFGVVEYGRIVKEVASIGMYVMEDRRRQGYAASILKNLQELVEARGFQARSGCWYYNHFSRKSMERAGAYSKSRLLRFYF